MNPAFSVVIFTTIAGAAQGLVVTLALAVLAGQNMSSGFLSGCLLLAVADAAGRPGRIVRPPRPA